MPRCPDRRGVQADIFHSSFLQLTTTILMRLLRPTTEIGTVFQNCIFLSNWIIFLIMTFWSKWHLILISCNYDTQTCKLIRGHFEWSCLEKFLIHWVCQSNYFPILPNYFLAWKRAKFLYQLQQWRYRSVRVLKINIMTSSFLHAKISCPVSKCVKGWISELKRMQEAPESWGHRGGQGSRWHEPLCKQHDIDLCRSVMTKANGSLQSSFIHFMME